MRITRFMILGAVLALASTITQASTLEEVKARGVLNCVVTTGLAGFAAPDENGRWEGFDVEFCRAVAAAVLGDGEKVRFVPSTGKTRFTLLNSGEGDILFRNTTETMSRDTDLKLTFLPVNYYDGQGFLIRKDSGITSAMQLDGASVCIQTGTTTELNLADFFSSNKMNYEPVNSETNEESIANYTSNRCDTYTTDASALASTRAALKDPTAHIILPEIISKEPLAGAVRHGDDNWTDIAKWVVNALIIAEELGVTKANLHDHCAAPGDNPSINRLCGTEGNMGAFIGLDAQWAVRAIDNAGNYAEIYEATIGPNTPLALERGLNASWKSGGILYAAPIR